MDIERSDRRLMTAWKWWLIVGTLVLSVFFVRAVIGVLQNWPE